MTGAPASAPRKAPPTLALLPASDPNAETCTTPGVSAHCESAASGLTLPVTPAPSARMTSAIFFSAYTAARTGFPSSSFGCFPTMPAAAVGGAPGGSTTAGASSTAL